MQFIERICQLSGFHAGAKRAIDWTREQIADFSPSAKAKAAQDLLKNLPIAAILLVLGSQSARNEETAP